MLNSMLSIAKDTFFKKVGVWILYPTILMIISFFMKGYLSPEFAVLFYFSNTQVNMFWKLLYLFSIFNATTGIFALIFWTKYFLLKNGVIKELEEDQMNSLIDLFFISQNLYLIVITLSVSLYNLTSYTSFCSIPLHENLFKWFILTANALLVSWRIIRTTSDYLFK